MSARIECPPEHSHGKGRGCYVRHSCRCEACITRNRDYQRELRATTAAARKANAYTKPVVTTSQALVEVTLSARDAELLADVLAERARRILLASQSAGVQGPIFRTRAQSTHHLAQQLHNAAERIRR